MSLAKGARMSGPGWIYAGAVSMLMLCPLYVEHRALSMLMLQCLYAAPVYAMDLYAHVAGLLEVTWLMMDAIHAGMHYTMLCRATWRKRLG